MTVVLTDEHFTGTDLMPLAIEAVEAAIRARAAGALVSPPRHGVAFGDRGQLIFTVGGSLKSPERAGFRVYETFEGKEHTQLVAVWSPDTAKLECVVLGSLLGELRTGAIGGVAIRHMSAPDARSAAVIGSGRQARMQLEAAAAVRNLRVVRVLARPRQTGSASLQKWASGSICPLNPLAVWRERSPTRKSSSARQPAQARC